MDDKTYRDMVELARGRARQAVMSVIQLIDEPHQRIALMINVAGDVLAGAAQYITENDPNTDADMAAYQVTVGACITLGEEQVDAGYKKHEARLRGQKDTKHPQPGSVRTSKPNPKKG